MNGEKLRVLTVINSLGVGGAERSLLELLPRFANAGIETAVVCLFPAPAPSRGTIDGTEVQVLQSAGTTGRIAGLRRAIRSWAPSLIHTTIYEADVAGRIAAVGSGVPVLTSLVNTSYDSVRLLDPRIKPWKLRVVRGIDGWTARHLVTHFHAVTNAVKSAAIRDLGVRQERITVVERGRDEDRLGYPGRRRRLLARQRLGLGDHDEVLVSVGRQEFQKGHRYLLEAVPRLLDRRPAVTVLLAGRRGNATEELEGLHRTLRLGDRVRLLGVRDDVPELLAAADLFVFPSLYEGLGGVLIEAMALGVPILASDLPAIREVVERGGNAVLVPRANARRLADAMADLLAEPDTRARFAKRSREIFEARFTIDRSARGMAELYRRVAGVRGPSEVRR